MLIANLWCYLNALCERFGMGGLKGVFFCNVVSDSDNVAAGRDRECMAIGMATTIE